MTSPVSKAARTAATSELLVADSSRVSTCSSCSSESENDGGTGVFVASCDDIVRLDHAVRGELLQGLSVLVQAKARVRGQDMDTSFRPSERRENRCQGFSEVLDEFMARVGRVSGVRSNR